MSELDSIRFAFHHRQADAVTRASRRRAALNGEVTALIVDAARLQSMVEAGQDFRITRDGATEDLLTSAAARLARAEALAEEAAALADLIAAHRGKHLKDDGEGPTTETLIQVSRGKGDPILRLRALDKLTDIDVKNAVEIGAVLRHVTAGLGMRVHQLERIRRSRPSDAEGWLTLVYSFVYLPWADRVRRDLPLMHGLIVEGESLKTLARRHGMSWRTACARVKAAFDLYANLRRRWRKDGAAANPRIRVAGVDGRAREGDAGNRVLLRTIPSSSHA